MDKLTTLLLLVALLLTVSAVLADLTEGWHRRGRLAGYLLASALSTLIVSLLALIAAVLG